MSTGKLVFRGECFFLAAATNNISYVMVAQVAAQFECTADTVTGDSIEGTGSTNNNGNGKPLQYRQQRWFQGVPALSNSGSCGGSSCGRTRGGQASTWGQGGR